MMKKTHFSNILFIPLVILALSTTCMAAGVTARFSWLPNPEESVTGYTLYYSTSSGSYDSNHVPIDNPVPQDGRIYGEVPNLTEGTTYYFVVTAHDNQGTESDYSVELHWTATLPTAEKPPTPKVISIQTIN